ncbi:MAG: type II toxin-antitoxin system death-on-curing family toxin [Armatimonadia bacterium]|nr:type II toxin-antitoxin system death-on-curing family toxin [Armatimonadia bacterium]
MKLLCVSDIMHLHERALNELGGGKSGILDPGRIDAAVARMSSGTEEDEFFVTLHEKAAALLESLIQGHAFVDGNKRTAILAANAMLELNGCVLSYEPEDVVHFAVAVATHEIDFDGIVEWLREHSEWRGGDDRADA